MGMDMKKKMTQQLEMRLEERKRDPARFDGRLLTDALVNCVLHDSEWQIPVGMEPEMENWYDDPSLHDGEGGETRVRFGGYEAVLKGGADGHFFRRQALRLQDGSVVQAAYTSGAKNRLGEPGGASVTAAVPCRKVLRDLLKDESVNEMVLNPGTDDLFLDRERAEFLLHAAERQITPRPPVDFRLERGTSYRMTLGVPVRPEAFANVETVMRSLRDMRFEFLICDIMRHEEYRGGYSADYAQTMFGSREGVLRVEICLTWEMNAVKHRMLLYDEMPADEAVEFFRELLTEDAVPERTRDFHVYYEEKTGEDEE